MLKSYFKVALRAFIKEKFFSIINIAGLSVGITVVLLIGLYIAHELSYDRFHNKADRIYRIVMHLDMGGNATVLNSTFPPMAAALEADLPEVERAVRLYSLNGKIFSNGDKVFSEDDVLYADPDFFEVFDFQLIAGNAATSLEERGRVVLTPALVKKYFGTDDFSAVVGRAIRIDGEEFEITGVVAPAPANAHFKYTAIASSASTAQGRDEAWNNMNLSTYLLLRGKADIHTVVDKIPGVFREHWPQYDNLGKTGIVMFPVAQPLTDIHLYSNVQGEFEVNGNIANLYIFGTVGLVVLLLAAVNFVNLVTARSANRAREVGVRKVLGSARHQLMRQFTLESIVVVLIATLLALGVLELLHRPFNELSGKHLPFYLLLTPWCLAGLFGFVIVLGLLAGAYPAFFLSSFKPAQVLKGRLRSGFRNSRLRNVLVTVQFVISIALITCTMVVNNQLAFMRSKKLGFDKENVLILDNANRLPSQEAFINAVKALPAVNSTGSSMFKPVDDYNGMPLVTDEDKENRKLVNFSLVDYEYLQTLRYNFAAGRNFSVDFPSDSNAVILNERAASYVFGGDALGKNVYFDNSGYKVVGIVRDFNFESLKNEVRPLVFLLRENQRYLHIRLNPSDFTETIGKIESIWKQQGSGLPFSYSFLDEEYNALFAQEVKLGLLFSIFTGLALFIACLGLLGLAAYMTEQRRKEISVRKVLGASVAAMVLLLSRDFARLMIVAFIIAVPIAYITMRSWLMGFVYRQDVSLGTLLAGGTLVIATALAAVSYQAIRAALVNPVESLKEE